MGKAKIAVTLADEMVKKVDRLVERRVYPNRSRAIEEAVAEKLERLERAQLAEECTRLDPALEKALAEEGMSMDSRAWPEY
ncbi:MAG: ribbon-helix-helix domain-containing protein [Gammaproteobacteria bacterium]